MSTKRQGRMRRKQRVRKKIFGTPERPRLTVYRSLHHISAQVIDDVAGNTIVSASTQEKNLRDMKGRASRAGAKRIGELIAERAKAKGVTQAVFDRNGYLYTGKLKDLANAAREKGLRI